MGKEPIDLGAWMPFYPRVQHLLFTFARKREKNVE